jgi:hypothetical protein
MDRKNNIGFSKIALCFALSTKLLSLSTVIALLFVLISPLSAVYAADKLVVKDSSGSTKFLVTEDGNVGIGGTPEYPLTVTDMSTYKTHLPQWGVHSERYYNAQAGCPNWLSHRARGTISSPAAVQSGDLLGRFFFRGYSQAAGSFIESAWMGVVVDGQPDTNGDTTDMPGKFVFNTSPDGSASSIERMVIKNNGYVGIGTSNPQGVLDVNGSIYQRGSRLHADYVFEPTYKMEAIEEHARYMWKNKHLQAISGIKKDEDGREIIEVGAQQRGIVEELEKAHVYIEQLNDKIKALEAKFKALESIK